MFGKGQRYLSIWFPHLATDWFQRRQPELRETPFVLSASVQNKKLVVDLNEKAIIEGIYKGMPVADAKALYTNVKVMDHDDKLDPELLKKLALWCIRFTPFVAIDGDDGLLLDSTGCTHLWGGDDHYINAIHQKLKSIGFQTSEGMADTIGAAWAHARFKPQVIPPNEHLGSILPLPPEALRLENLTLSKLHKLGLHKISDFISMPRTALRRRFGPDILQKIDRALGLTDEPINPVITPDPYQERLACLEPILTRAGIDIGLQQLVEKLCERLKREQKGLRNCSFSSFRIDGEVITIKIETHRPSYHVKHILKLFEPLLDSIEPDLGIEVFTLQTSIVEPHSPQQESIWQDAGGLEDPRISELMDRIAGKMGAGKLIRYLPDEHYWPERSYRSANSITEEPTTEWNVSRPRPVEVLQKPYPIQVTAPIPDYPPMLFRLKGKLHKVVKADGPERIEAEWWLETGEHRDYYTIEDEEGIRYWIFRLGHYNADLPPGWFLHGYFA